MINIGKYNRLRVARFVDFGAYLSDDANNEVLLPSRYVPDDAAVGDEIEENLSTAWPLLSVIKVVEPILS